MCNSVPNGKHTALRFPIVWQSRFFGFCGRRETGELSKVNITQRFKNCFMLSVRISSLDALGEFGEHERSVRVARGAAESNSFMSALQTS